MTITDHSMTLIEAVERAKQGDDIMCRCPAHDDGKASLHVSPADIGVLLKCHALCENEDIIKAVGLEWSDLFIEPVTKVDGDEWTPAGNASHVYPYNDEEGRLLYQVLRVPQGNGKTFFQRRPGPDGKWLWKLDETRRVPYRLPQISAAIRAGKTIYIPEGEKDVETLRQSFGVEATCNAMGAGKWTEEYSRILAGARVIIIQDADTAGRTHGRAMRESLKEYGCQVQICETAAPYKDVTDLANSGGTLDDLLVVTPFEEEERTHSGIDVLALITRSREEVQWVMPGTMSRRERLLVVGLEGHGKSTLFRQMAVQAAAGIHWWSNAEVPPVKALVIDAENEPDQTLASWQDLVALAAYWERPVARNQLTVLEEWDTDIDLAHATGKDWLLERIHGYKPDVCFLGPLSNMVGRDVKEDEPVRRLKETIKAARSICGTAFVMEHHAPHKNPSEKVRAVRPYGSSLLLRFPDYGYGMQPHLNETGMYWWAKSRWPRVRNRAWPAGLRWGSDTSGEWPWMECVPPEETKTR